MYGCESWTIKKAEHWRIDAFELWYWKRLLRVSWTARRSNQSILKEISPEYSLEGLMLKLKLKYFGHLMWRTDSLEKTLIWERLKAGEGDDTRWDGWMASLTQWTWVWEGSRHWWRTGQPGVLQSMGSQRVGHDWASKLNWTPCPILSQTHTFIQSLSLSELKKLPMASVTKFYTLWSLVHLILQQHSTYQALSLLKFSTSQTNYGQCSFLAIVPVFSHSTLAFFRPFPIHSQHRCFWK